MQQARTSLKHDVLTAAAVVQMFLSHPGRRIRVDLLSYESKTTDKREQYDWRAANFSQRQGKQINIYYGRVQVHRLTFSIVLVVNAVIFFHG